MIRSLLEFILGIFKSNTYIHYYRNQRTHLGLNKDAPVLRRVDAEGEIRSVLVANGLHHYYYRQAAQVAFWSSVLPKSTSNVKGSLFLAERKSAYFVRDPPLSAQFCPPTTPVPYLPRL